MFRPATSGVSALTGIVANGHQAVHFVSSTPSKIPYGGFSPVRLQTSLRRSHLHTQVLIDCHCAVLPGQRLFRGQARRPIGTVPF